MWSTKNPKRHYYLKTQLQNFSQVSSKTRTCYVCINNNLQTSTKDINTVT